MHQVEIPKTLSEIQALPAGVHAIGGAVGLYVSKNDSDIKGYFLQAIFRGKKYRQLYPSEMSLIDVRKQANLDRTKFRNIIYNQTITNDTELPASIVDIPDSKGLTPSRPLTMDEINALGNGVYTIGGVIGLYVNKRYGQIGGYTLRIRRNENGKRVSHCFYYHKSLSLDEVRERAENDRRDFIAGKKTADSDINLTKKEEKAKKAVKAVKPKPIEVDDDFRLEPTEQYTPCIEYVHLFSEIETAILVRILVDEQNRQRDTENDKLYSNVLEGLIGKIRNMPAIRVAKDKPCN